MVDNERAYDEALLRRWKKKVASDKKLKGEVHRNALRLVSGIRLLVEQKQRQLVEDVIMEAALVEVLAERPKYVM